MSMFSRILHGGMQYAAGFTAGGVFAGMILPQTFLLSSFQRFYQLYNNGFEVQVDKHTTQLAQEVLDAMNLKVEEEARVILFAAYSQDVVTKGSLHTHQGGIVGLPANFKYRSPDNIERHKVILNSESVNWDSRAGEMLAESLILSNSAKKFAIARGIYGIKSYRIFIDAAMMSFSVFFAYVAGFNVGRVMRLKSRFSAPVRGSIYVSIASIGYLFYLMMSDAYHCRQDRKLDEKAAGLSPELAVGGVEYYSKILQRNMALRDLLGASGKKLYTTYGNETQSWRTPKLSVTLHRELLMSILNDYKKANELDENNNTESM